MSGYNYSDILELIKHTDFQFFENTLEKYRGKESNVTVPEGVWYIVDDAFSGCDFIESITLPKSFWLRSHGAEFDSLPNLKTLIVAEDNESYITRNNCIIERKDKRLLFMPNCGTLPTDDSVEVIDEKSNIHCKGTCKLFFSKYLKHISADAFSEGEDIATIEVDKANEIYHSFGNCIINTAEKKLVLGCKNSIIPDDGSVESIGDGAFFNCTGLKSITIPSTINKIGRYVFSGCTGLTDIKLDCQIAILDEFAFEYCKSLTSIVLPQSLQEIKAEAFSCCKSLKSIIVPQEVKYIGEMAFAGCVALNSVMFEDADGWLIDDGFVETAHVTDAVQNARMLKSERVCADLTKRLAISWRN